jgi:type 1 glutamine amidotransferase
VFLATLTAAAATVILATDASGQNQGSPDEKIKEALPAKAQASPKKPRKVVIFSKTAGFRHKSIETGARALILLGEKTGAYTAQHTESEAIFEPENLKSFDAVIMLNTTSQQKKYDPFRPKDDNSEPAKSREEMLKKSLVDFVSSGKGLVGIHAACDTYHTWKDYTDMMGGAFVAHPWNAGDTVMVKNVDPKNPVNAAFGGEGFKVTDEIYVFRADTALPTARRYLLTLDETKMDTSKGKRADGLYPISWISNYGKGRTFYCSLGHNDHIYWNPAILKHYLAGIQYAMGDLDADASPTGKVELKK